MMRCHFSHTLLALVVLLPACDWQSDPTPLETAAERPAHPPDADQLETIASESGAVESARESGSLELSPTGERNPQREIADPYYLVGREPSEWHLAEWANSERLTLGSLRGRVLVVRFWTDFPDEFDDSLRSLQSLERLKIEFDGRPVTFVGIYHSKGSLVESEWQDVVARAEVGGLTLPLAYDRQWSTLNEWWRRRFDHLPTTPTFVISPEGKITYVHPGPVYFPSDKPLYSLCNADYLALREAIDKALPQRLADK